MTTAPTSGFGERRPRRYVVPLVVGALAGAAAAVVVLQLIGNDRHATATTAHVVPPPKPVPTPGAVRHVRAFSGVELAGVNDVRIRVGRPRSVVVHAPPRLLGRITTGVRDGRLVVGSRGSYRTTKPVRVDVAVPSLDSLTLRGSGIVTASGVAAQTLTVALVGTGVVRASGTVRRLVVTLSGSGEVRLQELAARDVRAVVGGSGRVIVTATASLDASLPGSGAILYGGNPHRVQTRITGSGTIAPR